MSRKRAISPYAIIVALLYLKRLKNKSSINRLGKNKNNFSECSDSTISNSELCLISIVIINYYFNHKRFYFLIFFII